VISVEIKIVQILLSIKLRNTSLLLLMWDRPLYHNVDFRLPTLEPDLPLHHTSLKECKISVLWIILMTVEKLNSNSFQFTVTEMMHWKKFRRKLSRPDRGIITHLTRGFEENYDETNQESQCPGKNSNRAPPM
jgi:hypothetical protein